MWLNNACLLKKTRHLRKSKTQKQILPINRDMETHKFLDFFFIPFEIRPDFFFFLNCLNWFILTEIRVLLSI